MEQDWEGELSQLVPDSRIDIRIRREAAHLLQQLRAGIIPSPKRMRDLRARLEQPVYCRRMATDGSCAWLRRNARSQGVRPPEPGYKVYCQRKPSGVEGQRYTDCPGYRRIKDED